MDSVLEYLPSWGQLIFFLVSFGLGYLFHRLMHPSLHGHHLHDLLHHRHHEDKHDPVKLCGRLRVYVYGAKDLPDTDLTSASDPIIYIKLDGIEKGKTKCIQDDNNPVWNEDFIIDVNGEYTKLVFEVKDVDHLAEEYMGLVAMDLHLLGLEAKEGIIKSTLPLLASPYKNNATVSLGIKYLPCKSWTLEETTFDARPNCDISLYQSAHMDEHDCIPEVYNALTKK